MRWRWCVASVFLMALACESITHEIEFTRRLMSGTFEGTRELTHHNQTRNRERISLHLDQHGDSVFGVFDAMGLSDGDFRASIDQNDYEFFIDFVLEEGAPCPAVLTGRAQVRTWYDIYGILVVEVQGTYEGDDCIGPRSATFRVRRTGPLSSGTAAAARR